MTTLHASNIYCIGYWSAGTAENWRGDYASFPAEVKGNPYNGWAGENWLDVRRLDVLEPIMAARADISKSKGFNAIEWDCVDGYEQPTGFPLTQADQFAYNKLLARICHERGMACFLKNCVTDVHQYEPYFEGIVIEQMYKYSEQVEYMAFSDANKPSLVCEYDATVCTTANQNDVNTRGYSLIYHKLALDTKYIASYVVGPAPAVVLTDTQSPKVLAPLTTSHSVTFTGLTAGQAYGFLVWSSVSGETMYDPTPRQFTAI